MPPDPIPDFIDPATVVSPIMEDAVRYVILNKDGSVFSTVKWDGDEKKWTPPEGTTAVLEKDYAAPVKPFDAEARVAELWAQADKIAFDGFDHNSRARANAWLSDPKCPDWRRQRIQEIIDWMDTIWMAYFQAKAAARSGDRDASLPDFPECPHDFGALISEKE